MDAGLLVRLAHAWAVAAVHSRPNDFALDQACSSGVFAHACGVAFVLVNAVDVVQDLLDHDGGGDDVARYAAHQDRLVVRVG